MAVILEDGCHGMKVKCAISLLKCSAECLRFVSGVIYQRNIDNKGLNVAFVIKVAEDDIAFKLAI